MKFAHWFEGEIEDIRGSRVEQADFNGPVLIMLVPGFVELGILRDVIDPEECDAVGSDCQKRTPGTPPKRRGC